MGSSLYRRKRRSIRTASPRWRWFWLLMNRTSGFRVRLVALLGWFNSARWLAFAWSVAVVIFLACHLINLGSGSLWNGPDSSYAIDSQRVFQEGFLSVLFPAKTVSWGESFFLYLIGALSFWLGKSELVLRLLPLFLGIGTAICLLSIAIDLGLGRRAGAMASLIFMTLPATYEISHRLVPDTFFIFLFCLSWALFLHALHGHEFDKHILPYHKEEDAPRPLPLNGFFLVIAGLFFVVAVMTRPWMGVILFVILFLDLLFAHRATLGRWPVRVVLMFCILTVFAAMGIYAWTGKSNLLWPVRISMASLVDIIGGKHQPGYRFYLGFGLLGAALIGGLLSLFRPVARVVPVVMVLVFLQAYLWGGGPTGPITLLLPVLSLGAAVFIDAFLRWTRYFVQLFLPFLIGCVLWTFIHGEIVLHQDDSIKSLSSLMRKSSSDTILCTLNNKTDAVTWYTGRTVHAFSDIDEMGNFLKGKEFRCIVPKELSSKVSAWFVAHAPQKRSILESVISIEEPPQEAKGPKVVLVLR